jgi:hypothetical protein
MILRPFSKKISKDFRKKNDFNYNQLSQHLFSQGISFHNSPVPIYYQPIFINQKEMDVIYRLGNSTHFLLEDVLRVFQHFPEYSKVLNIPKSLLKLDFLLENFRVDMSLLQRSRSPIIFEFNTICPGGYVNMDSLEQSLFNSHPFFQNSDFSFSLFNRSQAYLEKVLQRYELFCTKSNTRYSKTPQILLLGGNKKLYDQYLQFKKLFDSCGCNTTISFIQDNEIYFDSEGYVWHDNKKIDILLRRSLSKRNTGLISKLIKSELSQKVFVSNSFLTSFLGNKSLFALFHQKDFSSKLSFVNRQFIEEYIPRTVDFFKLKHKEKQDLLLHPERYVLKETSGLGGENIHFGEEYSQEQWEKLLERFSKKKVSGLLVQEKLSLSKTKCEKRVLDYDIVVIGEKIFPFGRISERNALRANINSNGYYVPSYCYY